MPVVALVVDDSMVIRHCISRFLEERGFAVESASNGVEALAVADRIPLGLIITDIRMPTMGGSELITALKNSPQTADVPIVVLTGHSSGFDRKESRAQFTIFKDIDIQEQLERALAALTAAGVDRGQGSAR